MLLEIIFVAFIIFVIIICYELLYKWKYRSILSHFPGPPIYPIVGSALEFGFNTVDKYNDIERLVNKHGKIVTLRIGPNNTYLVITDPELTEFFLSSVKFIKKSVDYNLFRPWLANGLLTSSGSYWQKRRKIITPTFHFRILNDFVPIINAGSAILVKRLQKEVDKEVCDIYPYITTYALDNICETAMGTTVNAQMNTNHEYVVAVNKSCKIMVERAFSPWKQFDSLFKLANSYKDHLRCIEVIHGFTNEVIAKKRKELLLNNETNSSLNVDDGGEKKRIAFLDLLLQSTCDGKPLSDADIAEEVNTFMFEGHDTTASAIAFALYELARNPHVQEEAVNELRGIFGDDKERDPTLYDFNNMKYMDLVIKETLRLYPSVPLFVRELTEDVFRDDVFFPKGLNVAFLPVFMHRKPEIFTNPEKFDPNRFLAENNEIRNPFAYIPFSAGPRNCIGQKFAAYELKSSISKVLRHFELSQASHSNNDISLAIEAILKSATGMRIRLTERKY